MEVYEMGIIYPQIPQIFQWVQGPHLETGCRGGRRRTCTGLFAPTVRYLFLVNQGKGQTAVVWWLHSLVPGKALWSPTRCGLCELVVVVIPWTEVEKSLTRRITDHIKWIYFKWRPNAIENGQKLGEENWLSSKTKLKHIFLVSFNLTAKFRWQLHAHS